jgi:beta-lactamase regulating signal transducer with metallopeptidase domain
MNALLSLSASPLVEGLGWTLVHFVWQGALLALFLWVALSIMRTASSHARYLVSCAVLLSMAISPLLTLCLLKRGEVQRASDSLVASLEGEQSQRPSSSDGSLAVGPTDCSNTGGMSLNATRCLKVVRTALPMVVTAWLIGAILCSMRLAGGWILMGRMRRCAVPAQIISARRFAELARAMGIHRPVHLLESALTHVPAAMGWLQPVILFPACALTGLSTQQLEAIVAHELAHLRRHDYLVNLLQCVIETLLFYHPGVWLVSRNVRLERENACDDLAIAFCESRLQYAKALVAIEDLRGRYLRLGLSAGGGSLIKRVQRLLAPSAPETGHSFGLVAVVSVALVAVVSGVALSVASASAVDSLAPPQAPVQVANDQAGSEPAATAILKPRDAVTAVWKQVQCIDHGLLIRAPDVDPTFEEDGAGFKSARIELIQNATWKPKAAAPSAIQPKHHHIWLQMSLWRKGLQAQPTASTKSVRIEGVDYNLLIEVHASDPVLAMRLRDILATLPEAQSPR